MDPRPVTDAGRTHSGTPLQTQVFDPSYLPRLQIQFLIDYAWNPKVEITNLPFNVKQWSVSHYSEFRACPSKGVIRIRHNIAWCPKYNVCLSGLTTIMRHTELHNPSVISNLTQSFVSLVQVFSSRVRPSVVTQLCLGPTFLILDLIYGTSRNCQDCNHLGLTQPDQYFHTIYFPFSFGQSS